MAKPHTNTMQHALDCINNDLGKQFTRTETLPGKSGAWAVDSPDGEQGVLKASDDKNAVEQTVHLVEHLRALEYPTPRPLHHGPIPDGGHFYLQERLPGRPMRSPGVWTEMNQHELTLVLNLLELHKGIAPETSQNWTHKVEKIALHQQGEWAAVSQSPLPTVQSLLEVCAKRCAKLGDPGLRHSDLVIGDFGPHNILLNAQGQVKAVFDLEGAGRGDRVIDLVNLLYMVEPELLQDVRNAACQIASPEALTACGVYWVVRRLYQGIKAGDEKLEPVAQQMLDHIDLLT